MTTQYTQHGTNGLRQMSLTDGRLTLMSAASGTLPIRSNQSPYHYYRTGPLVAVSFYLLLDRNSSEYSAGSGQLKVLLPYAPIRNTRVLGQYKVGGGTVVVNSPVMVHGSGNALFYELDGSALNAQDHTMAQNDYLYSSFSYLTEDDF